MIGGQAAGPLTSFSIGVPLIDEPICSIIACPEKTQVPPSSGRSAFVADASRCR